MSEVKSGKARLKEQLERIHVDALFKEILVRGLMNLPDDEAEKMASQLSEAFDNLAEAVEALKNNI